VPSSAATPSAPSIRVGIGWSPFEDADLGGARFWGAVDQMEEVGIDSLWLSDSAGLGGMAPLPALAAVAARTERLKVGTGVLVLPPRNPVLLARELATVDVLSGGRLLPAVGLGISLPSELAAMGIAREERVARLEESVAIIKELWAGEPVTRAGRFWSLDGIALRPRPVRRRLELWLAGQAPAALRRVGRIGDGWIGSFVSPAELAGMVATIRGAAEAAGRQIDDDHYGTTLFAAPREAELPPEARRLLERRPELAREDHIAFGAAELRDLLERFIAAGAQKFVVIPIARDLPAWLDELWAEAIEPVETRPRQLVGGGR
jgi:probable F420-dependent oxidoreductase